MSFGVETAPFHDEDVRPLLGFVEEALHHSYGFVFPRHEGLRRPTRIRTISEGPMM